MAKAEPPKSYVVSKARNGGGRGEKTYSKGTGGVAGSSPAPAAVQAETLVAHNADDTTATEGLGVRLALDLEDVERQQDNLTNADQTASRRVQNSLAGLGAEHVLEALAVVDGQVVTDHGLATVLVHTLQHLVAGGVAETGEQGDELGASRGRGLALEDDLVELLGVGDLQGVSRTCN